MLTSSEIVRSAADQFIAENSAPRLQKMLAQARAELLNAQDWLFHVRKSRLIHNQVFEDAAVRRRHAAADRVWDLQCMAGAKMAETTHPAITLAANLYDRESTAPHLMGFLASVDAIRLHEANIKGMAVRDWGDLTPEYDMVVELLRRQTDQRLSAAMGRYFRAEEALEEA